MIVVDDFDLLCEDLFEQEIVDNLDMEPLEKFISEIVTSDIPVTIYGENSELVINNIACAKGA